MINEKHPPFILIPFEILTDSRLTLRQIKVMLAICSWRKSNTNLARMSRQMISDRTGYSLKRVSDITTALVKLGWLKKSGNLGKKQWSKYEIQDLDLKKHNTPKTGATPPPKTGASIDTERTTERTTEKKYTKKKLTLTYSEKIEAFNPTQATADAFKKIYPLLEKSDYLELVAQFKDQALNRGQQFKDLNAGFRNYIKRKYIAPVKQVVRKHEIDSFRCIGDTVRALKDDKQRAVLPKQILINGK